MNKLIFTALLAVTSQGALAQAKADTLVVTTTPKMHCANCEKKIKGNIRFVKGMKKIETSVPNQTVTLVYDSRKANFNDFIAAFKKIGFDIQKVEKAD